MITYAKKHVACAFTISLVSNGLGVGALLGGWQRIAMAAGP